MISPVAGSGRQYEKKERPVRAGTGSCELVPVERTTPMIYTYNCTKCKTVHEANRTVEDRDKPIRCYCSTPPMRMMRTIIAAPAAIVKSPGKGREKRGKG